jgi:hypothetical protein
LNIAVPLEAPNYRLDSEPVTETWFHCLYAKEARIVMVYPPPINLWTQIDIGADGNLQLLGGKCAHIIVSRKHGAYWYLCHSGKSLRRMLRAARTTVCTGNWPTTPSNLISFAAPVTVAAISGASVVQVTGGTFNAIGHATINQYHNSMQPDEVQFQAAGRMIKILDWLTELNFRAYHQETLERRTPGTGAQFLVSEPLQRWKNCPGAVLWGIGMRKLSCSNIVSGSHLPSQLVPGRPFWYQLSLSI